MEKQPIPELVGDLVNLNMVTSSLEEQLDKYPQLQAAVAKLIEINNELSDLIDPCEGPDAPIPDVLPPFLI